MRWVQQVHGELRHREMTHRLVCSMTSPMMSSIAISTWSMSTAIIWFITAISPPFLNNSLLHLSSTCGPSKANVTAEAKQDAPLLLGHLVPNDVQPGCTTPHDTKLLADCTLLVRAHVQHEHEARGSIVELQQHADDCVEAWEVARWGKHLLSLWVHGNIDMTYS